MKMTVKPTGPLSGSLFLPGDKSISHRALLVAALAHGESSLSGLQEGADCLATRQALAAFGVGFEQCGRTVLVRTRGPESFRAPRAAIDCANSGTTMRLLCGVAAGLPFTTTLDGDDSLRRRPMERVIVPLSLMGARSRCAPGGRPPVEISGGRLRGISYRLPVASAQVKSAILLAGLMADGETVVIEPQATRDHTEKMLSLFGADIRSGGNRVTLRGGGRLEGGPVSVPGDFSAAAFFLAAGAIIPGSDIRLENVGLNPTRTAFLDVLEKMGAAVSVENVRREAGEPVGLLRVRGGRALKGVSVSGALIPNLIDEIPLLAVLGLFAEGVTEVGDAAELRVKESDRIAVIVSEIRRIGGRIEEKPDGFAVSGPQEPGGGEVCPHGDHRIAMALAVAGAATRRGVTISGAECIDVSFPGFAASLDALVRGGGGISTPPGE